MKRGSGEARGLPMLAQRVFNTPLMISEHKAEVILEVLRQRVGLSKAEGLNATSLGAADMLAMAGDARRDYERGKLFHEYDNIAVIPVSGTLVHRFGYLDPRSGMTGYDGLAKKFRAAVNDPEVRAIWLDVDSPGGEVFGCFSLCEEIAQYCDRDDAKPVWAFINEQATSAAYALACTAHKVFGPRTMVTGSISAFIMFTDWSKALDKNGVTVSVIRGAARKGRMTGTEPLDDPALAKLQAMVDETHTIFCDLVAMARSRPFAEIDALQGDIYSGSDAAALGLVDGVMSEREAWDMLRAEVSRRN